MNTDRPREPILHVDMDAFFAAVEQRDDPMLAGKPVAVGGNHGRGVVAAASYEARAFGVSSAMPMARARQQCPTLVVVAPRPDRYRDVSRQIMDVLGGFTPLVEPLSLDEAFLDVGGSRRLFGEPVEIAHQIRSEVARQVGLACSVGVGPSKFVAKLLSGLAKPDGMLHWPADDIVSRLQPLPVHHLWGAGPATVQRLQRFGLRTIGDVAAQPVATIQSIVGAALGAQLHQLARGQDQRSVHPYRSAQSISAEETFEHDIDDLGVLHRRLIALCEKVGRRLRSQGRWSRTITIKVRTVSFDTITRSHTLLEATNSTRELIDVAGDLLDGVRLLGTNVRLLGVAVSGLERINAGQQLGLLQEPASVDDARWVRLETAGDAIAQRYQAAGLIRAAMLPQPDRTCDD